MSHWCRPMTLADTPATVNHLMTLWMGSFVTVSCYDSYFVTVAPSDLNVVRWLVTIMD